MVGIHRKTCLKQKKNENEKLNEKILPETLGRLRFLERDTCGGAAVGDFGLLGRWLRASSRPEHCPPTEPRRYPEN